MINNRQGGRRRGRGGQRPQGMTGGAGGNRQDNRQRGNAAQLLEKYKSMARDAQLAGDRVQTEYFLQLADHYFRVLGESRVRFEEQRRQRGDDGDGDGGGDEDESEELMEAEGEAEPAERPQRRRGRDDRFERRERAPHGNGRADEEQTDERIAADVLPPAIAAAAAGDEPEAKPRRSARRGRTDESGEDIAPAA